jgi:hypothetical protein
MENTPNVAALKQVIRVLTEVEAKGKLFDLNIFACESEEAKDHDCGTSACAIGWCMFDDWHKKQGFTFAKDEGEDELYPIYKFVEDGEEVSLDSWQAVIEFYKIEQVDADRLFTIHAYQIIDNKGFIIGPKVNPTPAMVREKIEAFIAPYIQDKGLNSLL